MVQVIINDNDEVIGYYKDLYNFLWEAIEHFTKEKDKECIEIYLEELEELKQFEYNQNLLIMSDANGMGFIVNEYKGDITK